MGIASVSYEVTYNRDNNEMYVDANVQRGFDQQSVMSGRRGRSSVTGRYVSRDGGNSYADGYSEGYSEGMRQSYNGRGMSGHWPPMPYPERYRY